MTRKVNLRFLFFLTILVLGTVTISMQYTMYFFSTDFKKKKTKIFMSRFFLHHVEKSLYDFC